MIRSYSLNLKYYIAATILIITFSSCSKKENPIKYPKGTFPDSLFNLTGLNSQFDDYNTTVYQLTEGISVYFSSNRKSSGGQFDLEQGNIALTFDQTNGAFSVGSAITTDPFMDKMINQAKTAGNDFGPYSLFSSLDGYEYFILSSATNTAGLDLFYLRNRPSVGSSIPAIEGPLPVKLFNTTSDDAYLSLDPTIDTLDATYSAYFTSNREGNFDIYRLKRPVQKDLASWFNTLFSAATKVDSINTEFEDKTPYFFKKVLIFSSNRPGGMGGYDLYYSIYRNNKWSSAINLGPRINSPSDEFRPVIGFSESYTNYYLIFSSNRSGGKGGYDLYFTGIKFPK